MISRKKLTLIAAAALLAASAALLCRCILNSRIPEPKPFARLECALETDTLSSRAGALVTGYNYNLLERFGEATQRNLGIRLARPDHAFLDSLLRGSIDLLAAPLTDSLRTDSLAVSIPLDSIYVWIARKEDSALIAEMNSWIEQWHESEERLAARDIFLVNYSPYRISEYGALSPYDHIVREQADSTGNDWRLLSSIIYKESRFHMEAHSRRGASGLMQMMPSTALSMGFSDLTDPGQSVKAGALYLNRLKRHFRKNSANQNELLKFTLAAYNAGMGRIDDCIAYADSIGVDTSVWDSVTVVIPEMSDSAVVASGVLKYGQFKGTETIDYVNSVLKLYDDFRRMYPE